MKANLIEVGRQNAHSLSIKKIEENHFNTPFHFHDLCELNFVEESYGKRFVGDSISNFSAGDLVLMSPNLPHIWYNDPVILEDKISQTAKAIVVYFPADFLNRLTTEDRLIFRTKNLIERARQGMRFFGKTQIAVSEKLKGIIHKNGMNRIIAFFEIINILLDSKEYELLATVGYNHSLNEKDTERMNKVYQYLMQNFTEHIALSEIATVANLTPPAFCNFFKKRTQKSFFSFLNELRIGHACKLLQQEELTIADVCYKSGYQNFTNFNKFFKQKTNKTPTEYRKELFLQVLQYK